MKSPYGAVRDLSADCYVLVPLPIEPQTYLSNYNILSWRKKFQSINSKLL